MLAPAGTALNPLSSIESFKPDPSFSRFVVIDRDERVVRVCLPGLDCPALSHTAACLLGEYIIRLCDADDIALVIHNATRSISPLSWTWNYLASRLAPVLHHKFKIFEAKTGKNGILTGEFTELGFFAMRFAEYSRFVAAANAVRAFDLRNLSAGGVLTEPREHHAGAVFFPAGLHANSPTGPDPSTAGGSQPPPLFVSLRDEHGAAHEFNVRTTALYCLDLASPEQLPELDAEFRERYALPTLPADNACLLRFVPQPCRIMMGPNVYITPPGAFTAFHLDGGGTVDSGHQSLTGLNEVYMLRRMGPAAVERAMDLLRGGVEYGLNDLAHNEGEKPPWPGPDAIKRAWDAGT